MDDDDGKPESEKLFDFVVEFLAVSLVDFATGEDFVQRIEDCDLRAAPLRLVKAPFQIGRMTSKAIYEQPPAQVLGRDVEPPHHRAETPSGAVGRVFDVGEIDALPLHPATEERRTRRDAAREL